MDKVLVECNFQCLSNCPLPTGQDCLWDDPDMDIDNMIEYPEFFWWRFNQIFGGSNEPLVITPDMMNEYFIEPENRAQTRCPRCRSTQVIVGYPYIQCDHCSYNEPLIDFAISLSYHQKLKEEVNG